MSNIRKAVKAGSWYPAQQNDLTQVLDSYDEISAREVDTDALRSHPCLAAICPHAGFAFSGDCAAKSFYSLSRKHPSARTIIIFGATHTYCPSNAGIWADGEWQTPLGNIDIDTPLASQALTLPYTAEDYSSHLTDNAIELQLPFIKYYFPDCKILPIAVSPSTESILLGRDIARLTQDNPDDYLVIGSSDLTHYGLPYGFSPAGSGIEGLEWARDNDRKLIEVIEKIEVERILPIVQTTHSACGGGAISATVSFARERGITSALTLEHVLSYDIMPSDPPELSVGYASIVF